MKRAKVAIVVALAATLGVAACSSPSSNSAKPANTTSIDKSVVEAQDPTAHGPAADVAGFKTGGTITVLAESTPNTFDPTRTYYVDASEIDRLMYRTPTQYAIRNGNAVLVPDLTDLGTKSADSLTWTFKMQPGIKYMDGSPVQIADLKYAIDRSFAQDILPDGATYQNIYFKGGDTYKGPFNGGGDCACVETQGTDTLIIHLAKPFNDLPYYLTFPAFTPIPAAHDTDPPNYEKHPWTTGPYQLDSYNPGVELKLKKNPYWDPKTDAVRHQYPDAFDFLWGADHTKSQQAILNGTNPVDTTSISYDNVDATLLPQIQGGKQAQLVQGQSPCTIVANLDTRKITDINVRKAIAVAYPYDQLYKAAGQNPYVAEIATTVMPPSVPGYTKYPSLPGLTGQGTGDPAAAKAILQAAGKVGFTLSWYYDNTLPQPQQVNQIRTDALTAAGFTVKAIGVPTKELRTHLSDYAAPVNMLQGPSGWCSDWPSGFSWFPVLFESHSITDHQSWGFQADKTLDAQIDAIAALPSDQATAKWGALDQQLTNQYLFLPRYYDKMAVVEGTNLGGTVGDGTMGMPDFENMFVKS